MIRLWQIRCMNTITLNCSRFKFHCTVCAGKKRHGKDKPQNLITDRKQIVDPLTQNEPKNILVLSVDFSRNCNKKKESPNTQYQRQHDQKPVYCTLGQYNMTQKHRIYVIVECYRAGQAQVCEKFVFVRKARLAKCTLVAARHLKLLLCRNLKMTLPE